jgi:DNA-binding NtrC family response regulator
MAVLVVDDDENILHTLTLLLKSEGMECFACRSPQDALAALRKTSSQLALVDLNYVEDTTSGREGLALITALRQMDEELPIVAMTGWGTIGIAVEAMQRAWRSRRHSSASRRCCSRTNRRAISTRNAQMVLDLLRALHEDGGRIVMVTHDPRSAEQAQRQISLFDGKVVDDRRTHAATAPAWGRTA